MQAVWKFGPKVPPKELWQRGVMVGELDSVGNTTIPSGRGLGHLLPYTFCKWEGHQGLQCRPGLGRTVIPQVCFSWRPLFPVVPKICTFLGGGHRWGTLYHLLWGDSSPALKGQDPGREGLQEFWYGPILDLPGRKRLSSASLLPACTARFVLDPALPHSSPSTATPKAKRPRLSTLSLCL